MITEKKGFSYDDISIIPALTTSIADSQQCDPYVSGTTLPIFTEPLEEICNEENASTFEKAGIIPVVRANLKLFNECPENGRWTAMTLEEFRETFILKPNKRATRADYRIVITDCNGHLSKLYGLCKAAKLTAAAEHYSLTIMTGPIANPDTYRWICENNDANIDDKTKVVDYIRIGFNEFTTVLDTGLWYSAALLVNDCYIIKRALTDVIDGDRPAMCPEIVADSDICRYDDVVKALALGADYVMVAAPFIQCMESACHKTHRQTTQKYALRFPIERYRDFSVDTNGCWSAFYTDEFIRENMKNWENNASYDESERPNNRIMREKELREQKVIGPVSASVRSFATNKVYDSLMPDQTENQQQSVKMPVKHTILGWSEHMTACLRQAMAYTNSQNLNTFKSISDRLLIIANK